MVSKNEIRVGVKFDVDNKQLELSKQKLSELTSILQKMQTDYSQAKIFGKATPELREAAKEAKKLEQILNNSWNSKLGQLDLNKFNISLMQSYKTVENLKNALVSTGPSGAAAFNNIASSVLNTNIELRKTSTLLDKMALTMANTVRFGISSSIFNTMTGAISKAYNYSLDLDKSLNKIRIVSGQSADQMERYAKSANQAAKELGASTLDYTDASLIYYQQGLSTDEVIKRTDVTIKAANALGTSAEEVSQYMTAIWNNFDDGSKSLEYYADVITALGASTASSAEEIAQGLEKFAAIGDTVGLSYEYATSALATVVAETRQSADTVGTAFKTLFSRIQDLELGNTLEDGTTLGKYSQALEKVGINIMDQNGNLKEMDTILDEMGEKWKTLNAAQKTALAQNVAGTRQYTQLIALMDNWDKFSENLITASNATGTLQKQQDTYMESTQAHLQKIRTEAEKTYDILFDTKTVNSFADSLSGLLGIFNSLLTGLGGGTNALAFFGATFTNIFSKQIGASLERSIENFEKLKSNLAGANLKDQFAKSIVQGYSLKGESVDVNSQRIQTEAKIAQQIATFKEQISSEEYNQLTALQKQMGLNAERIEFANNYQKYLKQAHLNEKLSTDSIKENLEYKKEELQAQKTLLKYLELTQLENKNRARAGKDQTELMTRLSSSIGDENSDLTSLLAGLGRRQGGILEMVQGNTELTQEQIVGLIREQLKLIKEQEIEIENTNKALQGKIALEDGSVQKLKEFNQEGQKGLDQIDADKQRQRALNATVQLLSTGVQIGTALAGIFKTINDDSLSAGEKLSAIGMTLLTTLPMVIGSIASINKELPALLLQLKLVETQTEVTTMSATAMWSALLGPVAAVVLGVGLVVGAFVGLSAAIRDSQNAITDGAAEAIKAADEAAEAYKKVYDEVEKLKETISDYSEGIKQLEQMTLKTDEYQKSLKETNKQAQDLIEKFKLFDQYDIENGIIKINSEALENVQKQEQQQLSNLEITKYNTQLVADQATLRKKMNDFSTSINDARKVGDTGLGLTTSDSILKIINALKDEKQKSETTYKQILSNEESLQDFIKNIKDLDYSIYLSMNDIVKKREEISTLVKDIEEQEKSQKYIDQQRNIKLFQDKYSKQIEDLSKDKYGNKNEAQYAQIAAAINEISSSAKTFSDAALEDFTTLSNKGAFNSQTYDRWWGNDLYRAYIDDLTTALGGSDAIKKEFNQVYSGEDLTKLYLKEIKHIDEEIIKNAKYSESDMGAAGNLKTAEGESLLTNKRHDEMRSELVAEFFERVRGESFSKIDTDESYKMIENLMKSSKEFGAQFGVDFSGAMLNAITSENNMVDLTSLFPKISPSEREKLLNIEGKDLASALGLSDKFIAEVGEQKANNLINSFRDSLLNNYNWNIDDAVDAAMKQKSSDLEAIGDDLTKKKFEQMSEEVRIYATNLMETAKESEELDIALSEDADAAVNLAIKVTKMNKAINTLADNFENWNDILNNSSKTSQEYAVAMDGLKESIADVYDIEKKYVSNKYITTHLKELKEISEGNEEAIESLRASLAEEIILKIGLENHWDQNKTDEIKAQIQEYGAAIQQELANVEIAGALFRESLSEELSNIETGDIDTSKTVDALNRLFQTSQMTVEQANAVLSAYGVEPIYKEDEVEQTQWITPSQTTHKVTHVGIDWSAGVPLPTWTTQDEVIPLTPKKITSKVPIGAIRSDGSMPEIKGVRKSATGALNNYSSKNSGGGSPGKSSKSGGGSSKKPNTIDPLKEEADRYHKINTQITKVDNSLKKLQSQEEKFAGEKLIDNLNQQWALLNTQVENYNKKLKIAQGEQAELRNSLAAKGTTFNSDGTISNYMEIFAAQQNYVNSLINNYNSMSAAAQESYKEVVEQAKEDFKEFQKDLDRYDTLVSNEIPSLIQSIQDSLDKQIELNIKKFNMEVTITLDMADAERDWNKWKAKVLNGIKESDILGNAQARLQDFSSYYNNAAAGSIQVQTRHLEDTLNQLRKMDNGLDNVYGNNRTQALEDLQKYYKQLMEDLEGVLDLQTEIHKAYLDMMDEAEDKFKEQLETYSMIGDLLNNNMKIVQLIYGEDSYSQLSNYYQQQYDNNMAQLDFLRQQKQLWADQMELFEEGSEEWQSAKEKWMDAAKELSSTLSDALDNARQSFENTIKDIFKELNNVVTDNLGLNYASEEWELINKNAEQYLDTINAVAGIHNLETKYLEAIDKTVNPKNQQRLNALMENELDILKGMDKLSQTDLDRAELKYQIALAQIALEDAQQQKNQMRLRRDTQGNYTYQYTADNEAIEEAKEELSKLYVDLYNFDREQYKSNLDEIYNIWSEYQEKMAEAALINDPELRAEKQLLIQEQYDTLMNGLLEKNAAYRTNLQESSFMSLAQLYQEDLDKFTTYTTQERDKLLNEVGGGFSSLIEIYGVNAEAFKQMTIEEQDAIINNLKNPMDSLLGMYKAHTDVLQNMARNERQALLENLGGAFSLLETMYDNNVQAVERMSQEEQIIIVEKLGGAFDSLLAMYGYNKQEFEKMTLAERSAILNNLVTAFDSLLEIYDLNEEEFRAMSNQQQEVIANDFKAVFADLMNLYDLDAEAFKNLTIEKQTAITQNLYKTFDKLLELYNVDMEAFIRMTSEEREALVKNYKDAFELVFKMYGTNKENFNQMTIDQQNMLISNFKSAFETLADMYEVDVNKFTKTTLDKQNALVKNVTNEFGKLLNSYKVDQNAVRLMTDAEVQYLKNLNKTYGDNVQAFESMTLKEQKALVNNLGAGFNKITGFYNEDKKNFDRMADNQKDVLTNKMIPQWNSAVQTMANKISGNGGLQKTTENSMNKIKEATASYDKQLEQLAKTANTSTTKIGEGFDNAIEMTKELAKENDELIDMYGQELLAVRRVCDQIDTLINKYNEAESAAKAATKAAYEYWYQDQQKQAEEAKAQEQTVSAVEPAIVSQPEPTPAPAPAPVPTEPGSGGGWYTVISGDSLWSIARKFGGDGDRWPEIYDENTNIIGPNPNRIYPGQELYIPFRSGGYTGEWMGDSGRLALLHQKELVLNAKDTENMLNTVAIMRNLATNLGESVIARLAGVSANGTNTTGGDNLFEQNVHIEATFPGVKDSKEIENALNNLVNSAAQRAFMKR